MRKNYRYIDIAIFNDSPRYNFLWTSGMCNQKAMSRVSGTDILTVFDSWSTVTLKCEKDFVFTKRTFVIINMGNTANSFIWNRWKKCLNKGFTLNHFRLFALSGLSIADFWGRNSAPLPMPKSMFFSQLLMKNSQSDQTYLVQEHWSCITYKMPKTTAGICNLILE